MTRTMKLFVALGLLVCALPANALANDYRVYSCKLPDGRPAPADGWSPAGAAPYAWFNDGCASGGALRAGLNGDAQAANTSYVGWGFDSGPAAISSYSIVRSGRVQGQVTGASTLLYSSDLKNAAGGGYSVDYCAAFSGCSSVTGRLDRSGAQIPSGSRAWFFMVGCGGISGTLCVPAPGASEFGSLRVDSAVFTLRDDEQPQATAVSGSLTESGATSGNLDFTATDDISGILRASIEVDGAEIVAVQPSANGGRCVVMGFAGTVNDFAYRKPCPSRQQVEFALAPSTLATGIHTIRARVYDAAGNGLTVFGPRLVAVGGAQAKSANSAAVRIEPDETGTRTASFGREVQFAGTVRDAAGAPVSAADLTASFSSPSAAKRTITRRLTTDGAGRYKFAMRATASRAVSLTHAASGARSDQSLIVRSQLALRAKRKRVRSLGRMRLTGRIPSAPTRRGASVAIKVRSGGSWRTVGVVRASKRGMFSFAYRFRRTRHARLAFRAVALKSSDLAVKTTASRSVRIRVG